MTKDLIILCIGLFSAVLCIGAYFITIMYIIYKWIDRATDEKSTKWQKISMAIMVGIPAILLFLILI